MFCGELVLSDAFDFPLTRFLLCMSVSLSTFHESHRDCINFEQACIYYQTVLLSSVCDSVLILFYLQRYYLDQIFCKLSPPSFAHILVTHMFGPCFPFKILSTGFDIIINVQAVGQEICTSQIVLCLYIFGLSSPINISYNYFLAEQ